MRKFLLLIALLIPFCCSAQFYDDFASSSWDENSEWTGIRNHFIINSQNQLQLSNKGQADTSFVSTRRKIESPFLFEFNATLKFNPSRYNYLRIYLLADHDRFNEFPDGYYILLGGADDEISLYKIENKKSALITGTSKRIIYNQNNIHVQLTLHTDNTWSLSSRINDEPEYVKQNSEPDLVSYKGSHWGPCCVYTKTYSDKFLFDYFRISNDNNPEERPLPENPDSEEPDSEKPGNGIVTDEDDPEETPSDDPKEENSDEPVTAIRNLKFGDLIISEIMANPKGSAGLPDAEYLELYNQSDTTIPLSQIRFHYDNRTFILPAYNLKPNHYIVLCHPDKQNLFVPEIPVVGVIGFPILANTGKRLYLETLQHTLLYMVCYSDKWYGTESSSSGYSMEIVDKENLFASASNWRSSEAALGGTPGAVNSVDAQNPDLTPPWITGHGFTLAGNLEIRFSKPLDLNLSGGKLLDKFYIDSLNYPNRDILYLSHESAYPEIKEIDFNQIECLSGNLLLPRNKLTFSVSEKTQQGDILINEILYQPLPGQSGFVELYNRSDRILDLRNHFLSALSEEGRIKTRFPLTDKTTLLMPGEYVVVSLDPLSLFNQYGYHGTPLIISPERLSLYKSESILAIMNPDSLIIDRVNYGSSHHTTSRDDKEGISLERKELNDSSAGKYWRSGDSETGYATPGYANSIQEGIETEDTPEKDSQCEFWLPYGKVQITGNESASLYLCYKLEQDGYWATFRIYDHKGILVKELAKSCPLDTTGEFRWSLENLGSRFAEPGFYILWIEYFNRTGVSHRRSIAFPLVP